MVAPHTPAPWHHCDDPRHFAYGRIINSSDVAIAQPMVMGNGSLANAHLITAAPDLLAACRWMRDFIEAVNEDRVSQDQRDLYDSMMTFAGDSIAKAQGRS